MAAATTSKVSHTTAARTASTTYKLCRKISAGSFGNIYFAIVIATGNEVAVKLESIKARHPQRLYESRVYKILSKGFDCDDLFNHCNRLFRLFSMKTVLLLAEHMIRPGQFLDWYRWYCNKLFLINFDLRRNIVTVALVNIFLIVQTRLFAKAFQSNSQYIFVTVINHALMKLPITCILNDCFWFSPNSGPHGLFQYDYKFDWTTLKQQTIKNMASSAHASKRDIKEEHGRGEITDDLK
uniref:Protein kinase domain-containing protein n=1 Tax=Elaeophora elaphi TaxID=1147741 RepID=A0A0R3RTE1_9BILA